MSRTIFQYLKLICQRSATMLPDRTAVVKMSLNQGIVNRLQRSLRNKRPTALQGSNARCNFLRYLISWRQTREHARVTIGVRAGGWGGGAAEIMSFFGQNALDSGNDTWEKTL